MTGVSAGVQAPSLLACRRTVAVRGAGSEHDGEGGEQGDALQLRERNSIRAPFDRPRERAPAAWVLGLRWSGQPKGSLIARRNAAVPRNTGRASGGPVGAATRIDVPVDDRGSVKRRRSASVWRHTIVTSRHCGRAESRVDQAAPGRYTLPVQLTGHTGGRNGIAGENPLLALRPFSFYGGERWPRLRRGEARPRA